MDYAAGWAAVRQRLHPPAGLLRPLTHHYTFVSSLTIYADLGVPDVPEDAQLTDVGPFREQRELISAGRMAAASRLTP